MKYPIDYIATWFYKEDDGEACFYPQVGRGNSPLTQSIYMQIQVPFFTTFRFYNPQAKLLFFTNLEREQLPDYLLKLFEKTSTEVVTLPYRCKPPKGWYKAWMNQFYLYDMLQEMGKRMQPDDTLTVSDADCLCRKPLDGLFKQVREKGSALYKREHERGKAINGTSIEQMEAVYEGCYGEKKTLNYYGGEFIALTGKAVAMVNEEYPVLWRYNTSQPEGSPRLHEEAHMFSVLAARIGLCNDTANKYVKRMWTGVYINVVRGDEELPVWHLPSEKKTGLRRLFRLLEKEGGITDERRFWKKAGAWCGVPHVSVAKRASDFCIMAKDKIGKLVVPDRRNDGTVK